MAGFFPGLKSEDMPDGEGWAVESITLSTHNGTHMDAPWHFHSTTDYACATALAASVNAIALNLAIEIGICLLGIPHLIE